jgi:hypothetical protein
VRVYQLPSALRSVVNAHVADYGAVGDGTYHPLSERYSTLAAARVRYPCAIALTDSIDWAAIQTAIDTVDTYNQGDPTLSSSYVVGKRGGTVFLPLAVYWINRSLYTDARIRIVGQLPAASGGKSSLIRADPAGDYTNGVYTEKFMLKVGRRTTGTYWCSSSWSSTATRRPVSAGSTAGGPARTA